MRTPLVNGIAVILCTIAPLAACNQAEARAPDARSADASAAHTPHSAATASAATPTAQTDSITRLADLGRVQGNPSAKVWVVEISDLQCPYCKEWHDETYSQLINEYVKTGKARFAYINFPLSMHQNAMPAARAAMCASVQGKFWQMQDALFGTQEKWETLKDPSDYFVDLATKNGVNVPDWKSCLSSKSIQSLIDADRDRAKRAGVISTPSFLVGGRLISGAVPMGDLRKAIDKALSNS
jgi:protein-disulfide isomerase